MSSDNKTLHLQETVQMAGATATPLNIVGSNSKSFYGRVTEGQALDVSQHRGILAYEPTELVITARAGTTLQTLSETLAAQNQGFAFEPPLFGEQATLGGTIACGFSGPARPYRGAARDFVLGVKCLNGRGEILTFGGQVMKNVAGYDVSRLMVGALGTLGVLLEVSCKVLPLPEQEVTLVKPMTSQEAALKEMIHWGNQTIPLTASCFDGEKLIFRLSGGPSVQAAQCKMPATVWSEGSKFWPALREQYLPFFIGQTPPLWRLSVPATAPPLNLSGSSLIEWGGALRWLRSDLPAQTIREVVAKVGGHATLFKSEDRSGEVFHPLSAGLEKIHRRLKKKFDPEGILNPHRMAVDW